MRRAVAFLLPALAVLALAACGGDSTSSAGSPPVPESSSFYASLNVSSSSQQWTAAQKLATRVPALRSMLQSSLGGVSLNDLAATLGSTVDAAAIDTGGTQPEIVGMTEAKDSKKLTELLAKSSPKPVVREIDGWTVWGTAKALDQLEQQLKKGRLSDSSAFKDATKAEPQDGLATLYANGSFATSALSSLGSQAGSLGALGGLQGLSGIGSFSWVSLSARVTDAGLVLDGTVKGGPAASTDAGSLLASLPSDSMVIADLDASGLGKQLGGSHGTLLPGVSGKQLADLLGGELAVAVSGGSKPLLTVALKPTDVAAAAQTVQTLLGELSALGGKTPEQLTIGGNQVTKVALGNASFYVGRVGDALLLATGTSAFEASGKGAGGAAFDAARKALGMPAKTAGFVFVDFKQLSSLGGASSLGVKVTPKQAQALQGLSTLLVYAEPKDGATHLKGLLATG
ncbi:MAG: hypothetical protein ACXVZO_02340 [Gaiellaceae bacterium]